MRLIIQCTTFLLHLLSAAGEVEMLLNKEAYNFGQSITVDFTNSDDKVPNSYPYFAIFTDPNGNKTLNEVPSFDDFLAWQNDCGGQDDCKPDESDLTQGSIEFSAKDPIEAYYYYYYDYAYGYGYWPFRSGEYLLCFINDIYDNDADDGAEPINQELLTPCQRFSVKNPKKKMQKKAKVLPKRKIKIGENFTATVKTPVPIANSWVGIYKPVNGKAPEGKLDGKALYWGYTACETQQGDQEDTTNCAAKKKTNTVSLGAGHLNVDKKNLSWPQKKGKYFMCVNFHSNKPYNKFKCSKKITVK